MPVWSDVDAESRCSVTRFGLTLSLNGTTPFDAGKGDHQATIAADFILPF
jgi:hypothetical protein